MSGDDRDGDERDAESNVVRLHDWLGPRDQLVPFGPRAEARERQRRGDVDRDARSDGTADAGSAGERDQRGPTDQPGTTAPFPFPARSVGGDAAGDQTSSEESDFWGEHSAALHEPFDSPVADRAKGGSFGADLRAGFRDLLTASPFAPRRVLAAVAILVVLVGIISVLLTRAASGPAGDQPSAGDASALLRATAAATHVPAESADALLTVHIRPRPRTPPPPRARPDAGRASATRAATASTAVPPSAPATGSPTASGATSVSAGGSSSGRGGTSTSTPASSAGGGASSSSPATSAGPTGQGAVVGPASCGC